MSDFNDSMFRSLQQFIEQFGDDFDSIEDAIAEFMDNYNRVFGDNVEYTVEVTPEMESMDLMEEAMYESSKTKRRKLLEKAVKIDPENWDAQMYLIEGNELEEIAQLIELEKKARAHYDENGLESWMDIDARSYLRLKYNLATYLVKVGRIYDGIEHMKDHLELDEYDALGIRYELIAAYVRTYDWAKATEFFNNQPYDANRDERMVFSLLILAILMGQETYARDLFKTLSEINSDVDRLLKYKHWPIEEIMASHEEEFMEPRTIDMLYATLFDVMPVLLGSEYVLDWLRREHRKKDKSPQVHVSDKIIDFRGASYQREIELMQLPMFEGIARPGVLALIRQNYHSLDDFNEATEEDVRAIKHIGPKTIEQLKKNGVKFKES